MPRPVKAAVRPVYPARQAREEAGLSLEAAARALRLKPSSLRSYETRGAWPWHLVERATALYGCSHVAFRRVRRERR